MNQTADSPLVLALGDSLTAGYGLLPGESFAAQLEARLRRTRAGARVYNGGVSGDTTAGGLARLPRLLGRVERTPDLCLVELGANDAIRAIDPATSERNLDAILSTLTAQGVPTLLAGMVAPPFLGAYAAQFNAIFPAVAARHRVPLYPFFLDGVAGRAGLTLRDGLHPNARAIGMVADAILPAVEAALDRPRPAKAA